VLGAGPKPYPFNVLRNAALHPWQGVASAATSATPIDSTTRAPVTPFVMILDADAVPSADAQAFQRAVQHAYVPPALLEQCRVAHRKGCPPGALGANRRPGPAGASQKTVMAYAVLPFEDASPAVARANKAGTSVGPKESMWTEYLRLVLPAAAHPDEANKYIGAASNATDGAAVNRTTGMQLRASAASSRPRTATATIASSKAWLARHYNAGRARVFYANFLPGAYQGRTDMRRWMTRADRQFLPYTGNFEPYAIFKAPVPLFEPFFRGRGFSKSSWYAQHGSSGAFKFVVLPGVFVFVRTDLDAYRAADAGPRDGLDRAGRPANRFENVQYFKLWWACFRREKTELNGQACHATTVTALRKRLAAVAKATTATVASTSNLPLPVVSRRGG
jgi:hypothetical protein